MQIGLDEALRKLLLKQHTFSCTLESCMLTEAAYKTYKKGHTLYMSFSQS